MHKGQFTTINAITRAFYSAYTHNDTCTDDDSSPTILDSPKFSSLKFCYEDLNSWSITIHQNSPTNFLLQTIHQKSTQPKLCTLQYGHSKNFLVAIATEFVDADLR